MITTQTVLWMIKIVLMNDSSKDFNIKINYEYWDKLLSIFNLISRKNIRVFKGSKIHSLIIVLIQFIAISFI